jgi:hydrogenase maturation protein HypF
MLVLDPRETLRALLVDVDGGAALGAVASRFHGALAEGTVRACAAAAEAASSDLVVLSGGVFQNRRLLEAVADGLAVRKLRVLVPALLPANDGGIAYGQAAVAARRLAAR